MNRSFEDRVQEIWYGDSPLYLVLLPLAWIFSAAVALRRFLYAKGLLRSRSVSVPVVVVGNITVGGTGKTPLAIWLARQLAVRGSKPAIISRGYRGATGPQPEQATADGDPAVVGDEAILMAIRSGCPVVVHPDRVAAAQQAVELGATVILSDDGLQHYRLRRDFEIAVLDGERRCGNGRMLPAGPLREPASRLKSVDAVLVQLPDGGSDGPGDSTPDQGALAFRLLAAGFRRLDDSESRSIGEFAGARVHAVAGIGNPERFFRMLENHDIEVIRHPLPDHAGFTSRDLAFDDELDVVMTEKDAVKCRGLDAGNCWYVPVDVTIDDTQGQDLVERIMGKTLADRDHTDSASRTEANAQCK